MGFYLLPLVVLSFFIGLGAIESYHAQDITPPTIISQAEQSGQTFVIYRDAVATFQRNNPAFIGTVSNATLLAQEPRLSGSFVSSASNVISSTGIAGRVITCFATLPSGAISAALDATENDASLGIASGSTWTSAALGSPSTPLMTAVPNGAVVSVIQIGS